VISRITVLKGLLPTIFLAMIACSPGYCQEVIVNPHLEKESLKLNALRAIFSMRLRAWSDGTPVKVFVLGDEAQVHISFSKKKLQIFPHQLRYAWDRLVYSGTGQAPIKVNSEEEMRKKVAATPGAIGYLPEDLIDESVHVLHIQ
jgi:ABC-type phosphate transport system substrate-binding protein